MASYNKVILIGNLTRDPEVKFLPSGTAVANFGIAMNERYTDRQSGEQKESVCFVDVVAWARNAEIIGEHFNKGRSILVEGSLQYDTWENAEGARQSRLKVRLHRFDFVGRKGDGDEMDGGYADAQPAAAPTQSESFPEPPAPEASEAPSGTEDDIPF